MRQKIGFKKRKKEQRTKPATTTKKGNFSDVSPSRQYLTRGCIHKVAANGAGNDHEISFIYSFIVVSDYLMTNKMLP